MRLETERLVLRVPRAEDVDALTEIYSDEAVTRYEQVLYQLHDPQGSRFFF